MPVFVPVKLRGLRQPEEDELVAFSEATGPPSSLGLALSYVYPGPLLGQRTGFALFLFLFSFFFNRKFCLFLGFSSAFIFFPFVTHNNPSSLYNGRVPLFPNHST